jgi:uncharacterized protein (TIGR03067 family)
MRTIWCALLVGTPLALVPLVPRPDPSRDDLDRLQGEWNLTAYADEQTAELDDPLRVPVAHPWLCYFGIERPNDLSSTLRVQKHFFSFSRGVDLVLRQAEVRLDASRNPRSIDLTFGALGRDKACPVIYKLEGDKLTLCVPDGDRRPTEFKAKPGQVLLQYTRSR